jgi:hypothetical protein
MTTTPKRRWFAYSLRTLFVVVTVFGCALGWQLNWIHQRHELLATGSVLIDESGPDSSVVPAAVRAPSLLWLLGELGYPYITVKLPWRSGPYGIDDFTPAEKAEIERVQWLFHEASISSYEWPYDPEPREPATTPSGFPDDGLTTPSGSPYDGFKM